ncbi:cupin domain-containing protein [Spirosoma sp. KCTC 42546]|uniref:cupin domain-containing protein n=1 Tax=Spirosoma sp. KCTC 42546 TaxID=2520506 RepID=UPI0011571C8F|nr:cupin domain-containing protein [Spirosoma sp. KCTC 42546]QDK83395.1 cupin domain-containing protein [Spirosoma sp. KCTC 42546]
MTAAYYVQAFNMLPHPEGGYFAETYRSADVIPHTALPGRFGGDRSYSTAIYFLLESHHMSTLHRIQADEVWHFYTGGPLEIFVISPTGSLSVIRLGNRPDQGEVFQAVVPAGHWFGSKPIVDTTVTNMAVNAAGFSLVGCTVAPGFDFNDFEIANRATLLEEFPQHRAVIELLTT